MIQINGKNIPIDKPIRLTDYLKEHQYRNEMIAVELNEEIISKDDYSQTLLKDGDVLEIVQFMGGGC